MASLPNRSTLEAIAEDHESDDGGSYYGDELEDGGLPDHGALRRETVVAKVQQAFGRSPRRRNAGKYEYVALGPAAKERQSDGLSRRRHHRPREVRRCRRSFVLGFVKRALVATPFIVLMFFGVIHVLYVAIGRARSLWDLEISDDFLPHWGMPGHSGGGLSSYPTDATRDVLPIPCHSHNDYWRRVPLFDAIHWGCTGVEADVWLFDDNLYVGHNVAALTRNRTFQSLYVNPLLELLEKMNPQTEFSNTTGHGVFDEEPDRTIVLLVDFKTDGHALFPYVSQQLAPLREKNYLSYFDGERVHSGAVTVVATGNTPFDLIVTNSSYRDIFFDAPLHKLWELPRSPIVMDDALRAKDDELEYGDAMSLPSATGSEADGQRKPVAEIVHTRDVFNATNSYYASTSFTSTVGFVWRGHLSPRQMEIIRGQILGAKRLGLKARYWDTPSWPVALRNHVWHVLMKEGADVLNVDDLRAVAVDQWKARVHGWW